MNSSHHDKIIFSIRTSNVAIHTIKLILIHFVTIALLKYFFALLLLRCLAFWKKIAELKTPISYFIHKLIHHSVWYCWISITKIVKFIFFFWRKLASYSLLLLMIFTPILPDYKSFSLYTYDKTTFKKTQSFLTLCCRRSMVYFIHHWQQYNLKHR